MSFMALKLIGKERISHVVDLNFDYGLGAFAGLNVLPKVAAMTQYSYRNAHHLLVRLLKEWNGVLREKGYIQGRHINLDFHSIPHWGEESQLENHWVPTRGKAMKSVLCFFAQDLDTTYLCYSNGNLSRDEAPVSQVFQAFLDAGGRTFSCTSCMRLRAKGESQACPLSKMADLYRIIAESDRVITL